jgi:hypothetical protein
MRFMFALGVLIALCGSADAAKLHRGPHVSGPREMMIGAGADQAIPPGWYKFPGYPPIPPEQNRNLDPSNYGGA